MNSQNHYALAQAAFQMRQYDRCDQLIRDGLSRNPMSVDLHVLLGQLNLALDKYSATRSAGSTVIELAPDDARGYYLLAWGTIVDTTFSPSNPRYSVATDSAFVAHNDRIAFARKLSARCLELNPIAPSFYALKSEIEILAEDFDTASETIATGLQFDTEYNSLHHSKIRVLRKSRLRADAIHAAQEQLKRDPMDDFVHHQLAEMHLENGSIALSSEHARTALRINPAKDVYKQSYWDAVKAENIWFRPFVYWQFVANWFARFSHNMKFAGLIAVAALFGFAATTTHAIQLPAFIGLSLFILLICTDRPCMVFVDALLFCFDADYRAAVDRKRLAIELGLYLFLLALVISLGFAICEIFAPFAILVGCLFLSGPVSCFFFPAKLKSRAAVVLGIAISLLVLWIGVTRFLSTEPHTPERTNSMYFLMGYAVLCIAIPCVFLPRNRN